MDETRLNVLLPLVATVEAVPNEEVEVDFAKTPFGRVSGLLLFLPSSRRRPVEEQGVLLDGAVAVMDTISPML